MARRAQTKQERETSVAVGKRISTFRKEQGLTQVELAHKLKLSQGVISSYEVGRLRPHPDVLLKLADLLGVSADDLLGREPARESDRSGIDRRFRRRLKLVMALPKPDQDALAQMIDVFLQLRLKEQKSAR